MSLVSPGAIAPTLHLFIPPTSDPEAPEESASPAMRLTDFYERFVLPLCRLPEEADPATIAQDRESLRLWAAYTGDPPLGSIAQRDCAAFVAALKTRPGRDGRSVSPNTVRKHCTHVQHVLDLAGPRTRRHRTAAALLAEAPYLERPKPRDKRPWDAFTLPEIGQWLWACQFARRSKSIGWRIDAALWWRSLVLWTYNTGLRIGCTMRADWSMLDAQRRDWIELPAEICKLDRPGQFYVNAQARAAIEALRDKRQQSLFPWRNWPQSATWLNALRRKLLGRTAIPPARRFGMHGLRKALGTWLGARNPLIADVVLDHRGGKGAVTRDAYVSPEAVRELMDQLPQPRATAPSPPDGRTQAELF